jgi:hypothetical protein
MANAMDVDQQMLDAGSQDSVDGMDPEVSKVQTSFLPLL